MEGHRRLDVPELGPVASKSKSPFGLSRLDCQWLDACRLLLADTQKSRIASNPPSIVLIGVMLRID